MKIILSDQLFFLAASNPPCLGIGTFTLGLFYCTLLATAISTALRSFLSVLFLRIDLIGCFELYFFISSFSSAQSLSRSNLIKNELLMSSLSCFSRFLSLIKYSLASSPSSSYSLLPIGASYSLPPLKPTLLETACLGGCFQKASDMLNLNRSLY